MGELPPIDANSHEDGVEWLKREQVYDPTC